MKYLLLIITIVFAHLQIIAQTDVNLTINHKLGNADFEIGTIVQNNLGNNFSVDRMEYYISNIVLIHDGGTETIVEDIYFLVDVKESPIFNIGNFNITNLDSIFFNIGVDEPNNSADPALFPTNHPLAPQNPSMHWGWNVGYRFVAMEGSSGINNDFNFELHGLGADNYFRNGVNIAINKKETNGIINAEVNADYIGVVKDMDLSAGLISHGVVDEAKTAIINTKDNVFSAIDNTVSIEELEPFSFNVLPNPSNGYFEILGMENNNFELNIYDLNGSKIETYSMDLNQNGFYLREKGLFIVEVITKKSKSSKQLINY